MNKVKLLDSAAKLQKKWINLHPEVKARALQVLEKAERAFKDTDYTLHIFDGWRDISTQQKYMSSGTSFVNDPLSSYHPWGLAVDFVFKDKNGNWTWEPGADCAFYDITCHGTDWYWDTLGAIIESVGFEWGGRWKSFDGPHAQLPIQRTQNLIAEYNRDPDKFIGSFA